MKTEIKAILAEYKGKVLENEDDIWIESNNELTKYYTNGKIHTQKKVKCRVGVGFYHKKPLIFASEKSYQILGGRYGQFYSAEALREQLKRYNFEKKA